MGRKAHAWRLGIHANRRSQMTSQAIKRLALGTNLGYVGTNSHTYLNHVSLRKSLPKRDTVSIEATLTIHGWLNRTVDATSLHAAGIWNLIPI